MYDVLFDEMKADVVLLLQGLDPHLTYHNIEHTLDVIAQSERIADREGITDERELFLLKVAALFHDTGFLRTYGNHEEASCRIFKEHTTTYTFSEKDQALVNSLIMVTKIPQTPKTKLESIICDADLDYLGRSDFFRIADGLRREFLHYRIVGSDAEWEKLQLKFLQNHHYHTSSSVKDREKVKLENFKTLA
jgi:HD superfamily phosphodiesterase